MAEHQRLRAQFLENILAAVAALCHDHNAWKYRALCFFRVMRLVWPSGANSYECSRVCARVCMCK